MKSLIDRLTELQVLDQAVDIDDHDREYLG